MCACYTAAITGWAQNVALALQVLLGALTTALGAALSGKDTSVAVSILGGASTLVASFLARTKGTNEPQASTFRAQALDHFLREIEAFDLDHGHEFGNKWDDKISGFRLGLERILGNQPGSVTVNADMGNNPSREKWGAGVDPNVGPSGNGKSECYTQGYACHPVWRKFTKHQLTAGNILCIVIPRQDSCLYGVTTRCGAFSSVPA
ncbi:hypothetical protein BGY98DRAFT_919677 [Russula aff. rugulosa BPL654]|nr:hypothetical protein BGY98DRAFT_919677 [Russula aff. rugulosa BPL654]